MRCSNRIPLAGVAAALAALAAPAQAKLNVVASLPVYADFARQIGGPRVTVHSVGKPLQDPHFLQPTPWAITRLSRADAFLTTGLDLELWAGPLVEASANRRIFVNSPGYVDLSVGMPLQQVPLGNVTRLAGDVHMMGNPHFFYSPALAPAITRTIEDRLVVLDPGGEAGYRARGEAFRAKLTAAAARWAAALAPYRGQTIVPFHNSFPYFETYSGLTILDHIEPKPGINPSAAHLARLTIRMRQAGTKVILHEPFYNKKFSDSVARRTGAKVVMFYSQPGRGSGGETFIDMMDTNIRSMVEALSSPVEAGD